MTITLRLTDKEIQKLNFCVDNGLNINSQKLSRLDQSLAFQKVIREAIQTQYKKELDYIHQGEDHYGKELTPEII